MQIKTVLLVASAVMAAVGQEHQNAHGDDRAAYNFEYGIKDPHTHDVHSQFEHRAGKKVIGGYKLDEADGTQRIVKYVSGPDSGFEAIVERRGHAQHPAHYGKHGKSESGSVGGTSYVAITHWANQEEEQHSH